GLNVTGDEFNGADVGGDVSTVQNAAVRDRHLRVTAADLCPGVVGGEAEAVAVGEGEPVGGIAVLELDLDIDLNAGAGVLVSGEDIGFADVGAVRVYDTAISD